jgi:hypothetical protein
MPFKRAFKYSMLAATLWACGKSEKEKSGAEPAPKKTVIGTDWVSTLPALSDTVRARAARGDTVGLVRLMVGDSVYRRNIYPISPAFDSGREEVFRFVIGMHKANSNNGLKRLLYDIQDPQNGEILVPVFDSVPTREGRLHEAAWDPKSRGIRLFGSALCLRSGCQVVSFARGGAKRQAQENE